MCIIYLSMMHTLVRDLPKLTRLYSCGFAGSGSVMVSCHQGAKYLARVVVFYRSDSRLFSSKLDIYIIYIYIYIFFLPISSLNWISWVPVSEPGCALIFRWVIWQARYPRCPPNVSWMLQLISQMLPDASKGFPDASQPPYLRCAVDTSPQERQGKTSFSCFGACAYGQHNNNNDRK